MQGLWETRRDLGAKEHCSQDGDGMAHSEARSTHGTVVAAYDTSGNPHGSHACHGVSDDNNFPDSTGHNKDPAANNENAKHAQIREHAYICAKASSLTSPYAC